MYIFFAILTAGVVSSLIRIIPLTILRKPIKNRFIRSFLYYVPYVTLSVMTFPAILYATGSVVTGSICLCAGILCSLAGLGLFPVSCICCAAAYCLHFFI